ncbi:MAG: nuclear transport factor 2 family protein [Rhodospirillaceae bacterium]|jgi:hypothetical protein
MSHIRFVLVSVFMMFVVSPGYAQLNSPEEIEQAKNEIWALEQSIYASRGEGNFQPYIDGASDNYFAPRPTGGWTPGKDGLRKTGELLKGNSQEKLDMNFKAFTLHGDTAVIYYLNNRTMRPEGEIVDEWYEVIHVWVRDNGNWKILASMPRLAAGYEPPNEE